VTETIAVPVSKSKRNDVLKLIAIITMIIDHVGAAFFPEISMFRTIGRIAFPIFAYQLAIGYKHTSNLPAYAKRLFIFACISYVPYIYFLGDGTTPNPLALNVMFLLLAGVGALLLYDQAKQSFIRFKKNKHIPYLLQGIILILLLIVYVLLPEYLVIKIPHFMFSYGTYGLLMMLSFHIWSDRPLGLLVSFVLITFGTTYLKAIRYIVRGVPASMLTDVYISAFFNRSEELLNNMIHYKDGLRTLEGYFFQARSIMAYPFIILMGKKNYSFTLNKYIAYWFYPVHIALILIVSYFLYY
jgi:VanZ family protein